MRDPFFYDQEGWWAAIKGTLLEFGVLALLCLISYGLAAWLS